jgi:pimeloyl-ACP methyl ester carboxylesterase
MLTLEQWFAGGERVPVTLPAGPDGRARSYRIFRRIEGSGPWLTFLHGFPTCSWDWTPVSDALSPQFRLLMPDFLGYGDSDKPRGHAYTVAEQADIIEALWRDSGVAETGIVAHDFGDTVALELLARQREGRLSARITRMVMLNGGIYVEAARPLRIQRLLLRPGIGPALSLLLNERLFARNFASIFSPGHPVSPDDLRQHWTAIQRRGGQRNYHRLIQYIAERYRYQSRWEGALEADAVPLRFIWGMLDPVSGGHVAAHLRQRLPQADIVELRDIGHYPQLEVPDTVAAEIVRTFA